MLRQTRRTSAGWDGLPSWLFKKCSVELAPVVTHLVNLSFNLGQILDMWRTAIISGASLQKDTANSHTFTKIGTNEGRTMLTNLRLGDILGGRCLLSKF